jgi:acetyl/propionyl-CoA carboxylase alpha subunit
MISKLVVWGSTRGEAIDRMARALAEYRVGGIKTNLVFHRRVMKNVAFRAGHYSTVFIEEQKGELLRPLELDENEDALDAALAAAAIHALELAPPSTAASDPSTGSERSSWQRGGRWGDQL